MRRGVGSVITEGGERCVRGAKNGDARDKRVEGLRCAVPCSGDGGRDGVQGVAGIGKRQEGTKIIN